MSDHGTRSPQPPARPGSAAKGCLSILMFVGGVILLLPALCTLFAGKQDLFSDPSIRTLLAVIFAAGLAGGWLIWLAVRPRKR